MNNRFIIVSMQRFITLIFCLALIGCSSQGRLKPKTIRICDESGCSDQPSDIQSYDPSITDPQDGLAEHIPELEELARKDPGAAYDLGLRYFRGDGVRQDGYQALQWMRDAAERGDLDAQKALGRLYLTGLEEMGSDPLEAQKWLTLAASRGDKEAKKLLKEATEARKNEASYSVWSNRWRPVFYRNWYNRYSYHHYWRGNRWYNRGYGYDY
jgi:TPR repeat protein